MSEMKESLVEKEDESFSLCDFANQEAEIRKLIECPVCLEIPLPPIFLCKKGHIVCNYCQERTPMCPLCRDEFTNTRSFVAEGIVEKCIMKCKFAEQGCNKVFRGSEMPHHLLYCDYRPVHCRDCTPFKILNYDVYENHLITIHQINGIDKNHGYILYTLDLNKQMLFGQKYCWPQYYFKCFNKTFLVRLHASNMFICAWVCLLGKREESSKYIAKITYDYKGQKGNKLVWKGKVRHFREDPTSDIYSCLGGLTVPMQTIQSLGTNSCPYAGDTMLNYHPLSSHFERNLVEWVYYVKITEIPAEDSPKENKSTSPSAEIEKENETIDKDENSKDDDQEKCLDELEALDLTI